MAQLPMYTAAVNSPQTELSADITESVTSITVVNAAVLPPAPNLLTLGIDETAETVRYTAVNDNVLTVEREFQGVAKAWSEGTKVARYYTAYDHDTFIGNIEDLKQTGVNGKNQLEAAVIAKEGTVSKQGEVATFDELDDGIRSIPVGIDTSDATATAADIRSGKDAYVNGNKVAGSLATRTTGTITPSTSNQTLPTGIYDSTITVAGDADLVAGNIKSGVNLFGVDGSVVEATGDAEAGHVLAGKIFSKTGQAGIIGTVVDRGASVINASGTADVPIPDGTYYGAKVAKVDVPPFKVLNDTTIAGVTGMVSIRDAGDAITPTTESITKRAGFYNKDIVVYGDPDLVPANIVSGVSIFGVTGTAIVGKRFASGTATTAPSTAGNTIAVISVNGLNFTPRIIIAKSAGGNDQARPATVSPNTNGSGLVNSCMNISSGGTPILYTPIAGLFQVAAGSFTMAVYTQNSSVGSGGSYYWEAFE